MTREDTLQAARDRGHAPRIAEPEFGNRGAIECTRPGCNMGASFGPEGARGAAVHFTCPGGKNVETR